MMRIIFIVVCTLAIPSLLFCQTYTFEGVVTDKLSGEPLIGVSVTDGSIGGITNVQGQFSFESTSETIDAIISYVGYEQIYVSLQSGEVLDVQLSASSYLLDAAIITGNKYETPIVEAITSISIIKPDLISDANIPSLDLALDKIPGLQMQDGQANIRGGSGYSYGAGSRVLVLVDEISALQADAGRLNWNDVPVENIAQVEVVKGASSVLYGSAALNGIINIRTGEAGSVPVTRISTMGKMYLPPADERAHWWKEENAPREYNVSALHKQKINNLDLIVSGFYGDTKDVYEDAFNTRYRLTTKLKYRLSPNLTAQLGATYNAANSAAHLLWRNASTGKYGYVPNSLSTTEASRIFFDPSLTYFDNKGNKHRFFSRWYSVSNVNNDDRSNKSTFASGEYQFHRDVTAWNANLTAGITYSGVNTDSELFGDTLITSRNLAAYVQLDKKIGERLLLTIGTRLENNQLNAPPIVNGAVVPNNGSEQETKSIFRAGANYKLAEYSYLRGSFGQGYRYPTITEKFIFTQVGSFNIFPNVELKSETGWSAEVGIKQGVKLGGWRGFVDLSAFLMEYQDMAEFGLAIVGTSYGFKSQNVGDTRIKGLELELGGESSLFNIPIRIIAGYTYIDPRYVDFNTELQGASTSKENILKYRTRHNLKGDIQAQIKKFTFGLSYQYASEMVAIDNLFYAFNDLFQVQLYRDNNHTAYQLFDARIGMKFDHFSWSFHMNNILNQEIMKRPARLEPPRNIALRLDYMF